MAATTASTLEERIALLETRVAAAEEALDSWRPPRFAITIEEARERLSRPAERSPEIIAKFRRLYGRFDGPEDLSERMRDYLYGDRDRGDSR